MKAINEITIDLMNETKKIQEFKYKQKKLLANENNFTSLHENELHKELDKETAERQFSDAQLAVDIKDEELERIKQDSINRIKLAEACSARAVADCQLTEKLAKEDSDRALENSKIQTKIVNLETKITIDNINNDESETETNNKSSEKTETLMINQEMFERQLNMLKRSAKFILANANIDELAQTKESSKDFLRHLNNLQLTFDNLLANKDKYTLSEETNKCIMEAESLKKQLDELANSNWDVERLFVDRQDSQGRC